MLDDMVLHRLPLLLLLPLLITASVYDVRTREIPDKIMYLHLAIAGLGLAVGIAVGAYTSSPPIIVASFLVDLLVVGMLTILCHMKVLGDADLLALAALAFAAPLPLKGLCILPPVLVVTSYYAASLAAMAIGLAAINLLLHRKELSRLPPRYKLIYPFIAYPVTASKLASNPSWWFPLEDRRGRYRVTFNVFGDPNETRRLVQKLIRTNTIKPEDKIWCSYGIPAIPVITCMLILFISLGDRPLLWLLSLVFKP